MKKAKKPGGSKPEWDHRTNTTGTFDELWDSKDGRKSRSGAQRSGSPTRKPGVTAVAWQESTEEVRNNLDLYVSAITM